MSLRLLCLLVGLAVLLQSSPTVFGSLIVPSQNDTAQTYDSVAIETEGNTVDWDTVVGTLVLEELYNGPKQGLIIARTNPANNRNTLEVWMNMQMQFNPVALVIFGEHSVNVTYNLGAMEYQQYSVKTTNVTCPVINVGWKSYYDLLSKLEQNQGVLSNVTFNNDLENPWRTYRRGWFIIFYEVTLLVFTLVNLALGIRGIAIISRGRNVATVSLALEIYITILRVFFIIDPFAGLVWRSNAIIHLSFGHWIPTELTVFLLIVFYWHELVTQTDMQVQLFVERFKIPMAVIIVIVYIVELVTAGVRAAGNSTLGLTVAGGAVYLIIAVLIIAYYLFVSVKVLKFLSKLSRLRSMQKLLKLVTARLLSSIGCLFILIICNIIAITPVYNTAPGQCWTLWVLYMAACAITTAHILAFEPKKAAVKSTMISKTEASAAVNSSSRN